MKISFLSMDLQKNKIYFQVVAQQKGNTIIFEDKSSLGTTIAISIQRDTFLLERKGTVESKMEFRKSQKTKGFYRNQEGIFFDFDIKTREYITVENKIKITYDMLIDEAILNTITFQISFL